MSAIRYAHSKGVVVVGAAGNAAESAVAYPARTNYVISVGGTTEHGLPFAAWPKSTARAAVRAYRTAEVGITAAASPDDVETAIRDFVQAINALPGIETTEREDTGEAIAQLAGQAPLPISADLAQAWFDAERDF